MYNFPDTNKTPIKAPKKAERIKIKEKERLEGFVG
jgi:hypothetical protein